MTLAFLFVVSVTRLDAQPSHNMNKSSSLHADNLDEKSAERFARLALACVHKEYPNKLTHSLNSDADVAPPRKLTPAFYGCYDWHSSVHGHWLLARLARTFPDAKFAAEARAALQQSLSKENLQQEAAYMQAEGRTSFERPYGLAWLLQLAAELREWRTTDPMAAELAANLQPLEQAATERLQTWLPKLGHPVRSGEHSQTAFALGWRSITRAAPATSSSWISCCGSRATSIRGTKIVRWPTSLQEKIFSRRAWRRRT
jgi:hypothetical protein